MTSDQRVIKLLERARAIGGYCFTKFEELPEEAQKNIIAIAQLLQREDNRKKGK